MEFYRIVVFYVHKKMRFLFRTEPSSMECGDKTNL